MQQPLLAERADVQIHAVQRSHYAHGIGAIFQYARGPYGVGRLEELGKRPFFEIVVDLLVVLLAAHSVSLPQRFASSRRGKS